MQKNRKLIISSSALNDQGSFYNIFFHRWTCGGRYTFHTIFIQDSNLLWSSASYKSACMHLLGEKRSILVRKKDCLTYLCQALEKRISVSKKFFIKSFVAVSSPTLPFLSGKLSKWGFCTVGEAKHSLLPLQSSNMCSQ